MSKIKLLLIEKNKIVSCIFFLDCICFCNISNHLVSSCRIRFLTPHHRHSTITLITYACETHVCCIPPPSCSTSFHRNILPRPPVKTNNDPERQQSGVAGVIRFRCQLLMRWRTLGNPGPRIGYVWARIHFLTVVPRCPPPIPHTTHNSLIIRRTVRNGPANSCYNSKPETGGGIRLQSHGSNHRLLDILITSGTRLIMHPLPVASSSFFNLSLRTG